MSTLFLHLMEFAAFKSDLISHEVLCAMFILEYSATK